MVTAWLDNKKEISIHALREEGDPFRAGRRRAPSGISIHALREEGDLSGSPPPPLG